eukprot:TRINITY_DN5105_c0_g1_i2.p1 TRINITY_DN5105_c0_g1~~TRINITY_DN5105_c0_g1_i2.p1  ORF type:complete len:332 (-),score=55.94 TRINITY_DN5105_c0_g1_i2:62-955(-)
MKVVKALQIRGDVVAMTGDGVNDAASIKQADVGIAMGQAGTEITRQASDIILADDNFATIVSAVQEGRRIFNNISKFIIYLLACNLSEVIVMFICVAAGIPAPFGSLMILWANIFVDIPPSLALGVEGVESDEMRRPPRPTNSGILDMRSSSLVIFHGLTMSLICVAFYTYELYVRAGFRLGSGLHFDASCDAICQSSHLQQAQSIAFLILFTIQLLHSFAARSLKVTTIRLGTLTENKWMLFGVTLGMFFVVLGLYLPGLNSMLGLAPVGWGWIRVLLAVTIHMVFVEACKLYLRW